MTHQNKEGLEALLPCPFCGGSSIYVEPDERGSGGQWVAPIHIGCSDCRVDMAQSDFTDEAVAAWNRRPDHSPDASNMADPLISSLREENESLRNAFEMSAQESSEVIIALQQENERLRRGRDEADQALVDRYRDPKTGSFSFPGDVAAIVRALSASQAQLKIYREALEPMKEVLRISDRKHPAWDAVRNAIASIEAHTALSQELSNAS